jgi:hypothetical protein
MVCNFCFENVRIRQYIEENGKKAKLGYECSECKEKNEDLIDDMYIFSKQELAEKLKEIIVKLYEHENNHGLVGSAISYAEDGDDPSMYHGCVSLIEVCEDIFGDGDKLAQIISDSINERDIMQGDDDLFSDIYSEVWKDNCWWDNDQFNWKDFSRKVKHSLRFFDDKHFNRLENLSKLNNLFDKLGIYEYSDGTAFRARGAQNNDEAKSIQSNPAKELGQVPQEKASHNRFSPSGISYIYLSFDEKTAVSEIYDKHYIKYYVGRFKLQNNLNLLNLTKYRFDEIKSIYTNPFNEEFELNMFCSIEALKEFISEIQKPINAKDTVLEYIPTQIIAEYIRLQGYDGFIFNSTKDNGINIVLFENKIKYMDFQEKKVSVNIELN